MTRIPISDRANALVIAAFALGTVCVMAQQPSPQATPQAPAIRTSAAAKRKPHQQNSPKAKPAAAQPVPAPEPPAAPPPPNWPVNDQPNPASVVWNSQGLRIEAANSSLRQILNEVATATGAKVQGLGSDQRIFGTYGPGPARDVLTQLLDGSGYNFLMIGDGGQGTPRQIVLTSPPKGPAPPVPQNQNSDAEENNDIADQPQPQPQPPPMPPPPSVRNGFNPGQVRTPQQIIQELQQRQQQIQQMQQQQMQQQQNNPQ
jgi:hypothetical protein